MIIQGVGARGGGGDDGDKQTDSWILNDVGRNSLLGNGKKIAEFLMRTFTCRSTFLYASTVPLRRECPILLSKHIFYLPIRRCKLYAWDCGHSVELASFWENISVNKVCSWKLFHLICEKSRHFPPVLISSISRTFLSEGGKFCGTEIHRREPSRVRPHFRFGSEIWNWSENFVSLRSEKKAWFHMIHFDAKPQKSEAKMKVK